MDELQLIKTPRRVPATWLVVVEDRAGQMAPWFDAVEALVELAQQSGRFVRVQYVAADLSERESRATSEALRELHRTLASAGQPGQPVLVLLITDGLASGIASGVLSRALRRLPAEAQLTWTHPWGELHWMATPLLSRLLRCSPRPMVPGSSAHEPLRPALIPWSPEGLARLENWAQRRTTRGLMGVRLPERLVWPRRSMARQPSLDWSQRVSQLGRVADAGTRQLLALAAAAPGYVDLDLLWAFAGHGNASALTTVPITRFHLAQALASGLLEQVPSEHGLVVRFRGDDTPQVPARNAALQWLDREHAKSFLTFLVKYLSTAA
ncbi:MAG: hypothetical protein MJE77_20960 [Proteobacteria bacterium]|nr:hypothetical protein [Pseudomonadota bacterium]